MVKTPSPFSAFPLRITELVWRKRELCVFRAQLRLRIFIFGRIAKMKRRFLTVVLFVVLLLVSMSACDFEYEEQDASFLDVTTTQNAAATDETIAETTEQTVETTSEATTATKHTHKYAAATCTKPQTCSCGETKGKAAGHDWKAATCKDPKTCKECGKTSGKTAGHKFSNGKCKTCGKADPDYKKVTMVWIPTNGGTKYHTHSGCSNMKNPKKVTESKAQSSGFTPCKRCH